MKTGFLSMDHLRDWTGITRLIDRIAADMARRGHEVYLLAHENKAKNSIPVGSRDYPHTLVTFSLDTPENILSAREKIGACELDVCMTSMGNTDLLFMPRLFYGSNTPYIIGEAADPRVFVYERWQPYEHFSALNGAAAIQILLEEYYPYYPDVFKPRITVIGNPAPQNTEVDFSARRSKETRYIAAVGRFNEADKRFSVLLRAFALFFKDFPEWRLKLVGDGPYWEYYNANGTSVFSAVWTGTQDINLYARWVPITHTITLIKNGGSGGTDALQVALNMPIPASIQRPTRAGYTFNGYWSADSGGTQYYNANGTRVFNTAWAGTQDINLYARWTPIVYTHTYNIILNKNGGSGGTNSLQVALNQLLPASILIPAREGYIFNGYWVDISGGTQYYNYNGTRVFNSAWTGTEDVILYARWTPVTHNIPLVKNGGSGGTDTLQVALNLPIPESIQRPTRTGYTFNGYWSADSGGTQYYNANGTRAFSTVWTRTQDTHLYARWTSVTYNISLIKNGGSGGTNTLQVILNQLIPASVQIPVRAGYIFNGY